MQRSILAFLTLAVLMSFQPAHAQTSARFGRTSVGTIPSTGLSANFKRASRFTVSTPATLLQLCAYLDGNGGVSGAQPVTFVLYRDNNGTPGAKVMETQGFVVLSESAARWYCQSSEAFTPIPAGAYWIAIHTSAPGGIIRDYYDGSANWYGNADAFADGASSSFGPGNAGSGTLSVHARYYPDSQMRHAGRLTIGTTPSNGMTADFKRGSSFVMPERGKLSAITAYIDGLGTTSTDAQQSLRFVLYRDANGSPGEKVFEGGPRGRRGGNPAAWLTDAAPPAIAPTLDPGRYWIALQTGATGGVIRNYADGTGNWYGNADTFSDGANTPFGAGNTGNGTISAFISYRPGAITTGVLGRDDIATIPSRGLTPNVLRWSTFVMQDRLGSLAGLHAYLDGLGAPSGSQPVRMVLYVLRVERDADRNEFGVYYKIAESEQVTITAGMQPQWVRFPVPSVPVTNDVPPVYLVGIHTGGTVGVVRDYGDTLYNPGGGNWFSVPDAFTDGAIASFRPDQTAIATGDVTMSVYASYSLAPP
jgi:hypothetical protein